MLSCLALVLSVGEERATHPHFPTSYTPTITPTPPRSPRGGWARGVAGRHWAGMVAWRSWGTCYREWVSGIYWAGDPGLRLAGSITLCPGGGQVRRVRGCGVAGLRLRVWF